MKTEDLFKYGVTRKEGPYAGKRFKVCSINREGVEVCEWGEEEPVEVWSHGGYKLWEPPKTLFDDDDIRPTWGNLKKAMEASGLSDDTLFISDLTTFDPFSLLNPNRRFGARFRVVKQIRDDKGTDEIMVY